MNVTESGIKTYIETFLSSLNDTAGKFFDEDQAKKLLHISLLPAKIICYVSTQFGIAFEYISDSKTSIEVIRGSARVEDLLVKAPSRLRTVGPMINISASNCGIETLTLADAFPFRLSKLEASVSLREVQFSAKALGWQRDIEYAEVFGDRQAESWSKEAAQSRAKDEVLAALFIAQQAKRKDISLHEYISTLREKTVLLLGDYKGEGQKRLDHIADALKDIGYDPLLIKDVQDFEHYDLAQKVVAIGSLSRFVVVDDSSPSGHLMEVELCKANRWVTVLLHAQGIRASWMTAGAAIYSNVILDKDYDPESPKYAISDVTTWAEDKLNEIKKGLNNNYPWRMKS
ncbi:MAG: hypothetical protein HZA20_03965 [Nitrospirae bacterium]|nr:hypothetical protein [Nitrospirota bacterium]